MNVAEFIEWLKTQDQEAIVNVLVKTSYDDFEFKEFNGNDYSFYNFTDIPGEFHGKKFLDLGIPWE